jgi:hypothetical protein
LRQLKTDNPNVSFPAEPPLDLLASYAVHPYTIAGRPTPTEAQRVVDAGFQEINTAWFQTWALEDLPLADAERRVRADRDGRLASTDWTQVADAPVDQAAWAVYRQALRDIPQQAGFPYTVTWPQEP